MKILSKTRAMLRESAEKKKGTGSDSDSCRVNDQSNKKVTKKRSNLSENDVEKVRYEIIKKNYTLEEKLGEGGYATVFRLTNSLYNNQSFALKVFRRSIETSVSINLSFESECDALLHLNHPNIIKFYDSFSTPDFYFIVLEYCPFGTLKDIPDRLAEAQFRSIAYTILTTVKFVHDRGYAHCDIKPQNFLIDEHGRVKISDFGLSLNCGQLCGKRSKRFGGSKPFLSPEILSHMPYDPKKSDVWSLAVMFYYLVAKKLPWSSCEPAMMKKEILSGMINYPNNMDPKIGWFLTSMFVSCPEMRPSIDQILESDFFNCGMIQKLPTRVVSLINKKCPLSMAQKQTGASASQKFPVILTRVPLISEERMKCHKKKLMGKIRQPTTTFFVD